MNRNRFAVFYLYLVILLLALTGLYAKTIPLNAITIIHLRGIVAMLGVGLFSLVRQRSLRFPNRHSAIGVYALGLLLGVHWATFFSCYAGILRRCGYAFHVQLPGYHHYSRASIQQATPEDQ